MNTGRTLLKAKGIVDGMNTWAEPGAVLIDHNEVIAAGSPETLEIPGDVRDVTVVDLPHSVLIPGLVNAHSHLDLTHIGPVAYSGSFTSWVDGLRGERKFDDAAIADSVRLGIDLSRLGGIALIGDICGVRSTVPLDILRESHLPGVGFVEVFGLGELADAAIETLKDAIDTIDHDHAGVRLGLQPHASYSCDRKVFDFATGTGLPVSTHLAETLEEVECTRSGTGPMADMLKRLGVWDSFQVAPGLHPVDHLQPALTVSPVLAAHLNYIDDTHLDVLAKSKVTVAYCPRASAYFGHPHQNWPTHQYQEMLNRGINVALGTDSILCLDTCDRISVLDDMRFLFKRDQTDPQLLLKMGTINGALGLGFDPGLVTFDPGCILGILAIDVDPTQKGERSILESVLHSSEIPRWVFGPTQP